MQTPCHFAAVWGNRTGQLCCCLLPYPLAGKEERLESTTAPCEWSHQTPYLLVGRWLAGSGCLKNRRVYLILPLIRIPGLVSMFRFSIETYRWEVPAQESSLGAALPAQFIWGKTLPERHVSIRSCSPEAGKSRRAAVLCLAQDEDTHLDPHSMKVHTFSGCSLCCIEGRTKRRGFREKNTAARAALPFEWRELSMQLCCLHSSVSARPELSSAAALGPLWPSQASPQLLWLCPCACMVWQDSRVTTQQDNGATSKLPLPELGPRGCWWS